ncbi:MFS transporter [Agromyces sp. Root81]|uniref:MFS transporter n=1 Tax=Agromyces sp. Root81 TaxID=1736601 RepID=UPI000B27B47C|nr:MFS transporter [Agromyces sp. Root81]
MSQLPLSTTAESAPPRPRPGGGFFTIYVLAYLGAYVGIMGPGILALYTRLTELFPPAGEGVTSVGALAIVSAAGAIAAALANPFIGRLSDRTTSRFGMRRPWIVVSALVFALGLLIVTFGPAELTTIAIGWTVSQIGCNGLLAVYTAVLPDQVPERHRGTVAAWLGVAMNVAALPAVWLVGLFAAGTVTFDDAGAVIGGEPGSPWRFLAPLVVALLTAAALFFALTPYDRHLAKSEVTPYSLRDFFGSFVFDPRKSPDFAWAWISRFFFMLGIAYLLVYQTPYSQLHLGFEGPELDAVVLWGTLVMVIGSVITGYASGKLSDVFRRRKVFVVTSALIYAVSLLFLVFAAPDHSGLPMALVGLFIGGLAQGVYFGVDLALATDVLPDKDADAAKDLGVFNIASAAPQFVAPFIAPFFLGLTWLGQQPGMNFAALFLFAALFSAVGALLVMPIRRVR